MISDFKKIKSVSEKVFETARTLLAALPYVQIFRVKVAQILSLKERYLYTRHGTLRLRYLILPVCLVLVGAPLLIVGISKVQGVSFDRAVSGTAMQAQDSPLASMLDGSLYGQLSLVSAMTRTVPGPTSKIVAVEPGDALGKIMEKAGIGNQDVHKVITAMEDTFDPRDLRAGQDVHMHFEPDTDGTMGFEKMKIPLSPLKTLVVARGEDGFDAVMDEKDVERVIRAQQAQIEVSLYGSAAKAGIPVSVVANAIRVYSWNVDFQRDIRQGDTLQIMYESYETEDGHVAETGNILYANLTLNGKPIPLYRFEMQDGRSDYFGPDGISIKRTLMKTPIDGARMSSGYGMRRHPILGYNKMHKGVDFAAPTGTPIYAAGDGIVEFVGRRSGYGKYVRLRHNSRLKTAYAHMSRYHKRAKVGARVKQGEVIAYVGSTGRSTGPHLHYEVHLNGKQVNPRSVNLPTGEELRGTDLKKFKRQMKNFDREYAALTKGLKFAQVRSSKDETKGIN